MVGTATQLEQRLAAPQVCTQSARDAYDRVLAQVGATLPERDEVDAALVKAIQTQGGMKIQDEHDTGAGDEGYGTLASATAPADTDRDGMPDAWESAPGLDPKSADDRNADADGDGYTNLEAYLAELAAPAFAL